MSALATSCVLFGSAGVAVFLSALTTEPHTGNQTESTEASSPEAHFDTAATPFRNRFRTLGSRIEAPLAVVLLTLLYGALTIGQMSRRLWFDELFTYYIAQAPTLGQLIDALIHLDLNPPLIYWLVRFFQDIFGRSEIVTRLPATIAFYLGSLAAFLALRRRVGVWWSAAAIVAFWGTPFFRYATQARPYGLMVGFFSLTVLCYDIAVSAERRRWAVPGIAAGTVGMMMSHVFAPLSILPFCVAETVRSVIRRRLDWPVWASLLLPLTLCVQYVPEIHYFQTIDFPQVYQASREQIIYFYLRLAILDLFPGAFLAIPAALIVLPFSRCKGRKVPGGWAAAAWFVTAILLPVAINLLLMHTGGAFWDRYCITSALVFDMLVVISIGWVTGFRRSSAVAVALIFSAVCLIKEYPPDSQTPNPGEMSLIRQDLPLVAGSGLTFLELDKYEEPALLSRLYYLTDRNAALQYAHATIFENMPLLARYFPIRAHVSPYGAFVATHPHFLVLTRADYREDWVMLKLCADGASVKRSASLRGPFKDFQLYEVQR